MRKTQIIEEILDRAQNKYIMWLITHNIKYYDLSLIFLELYCDITGKSFIDERLKLWKGFNNETYKSGNKQH